MTIKKTIIKLQELKAAVLKDHKIDYAESQVLLDFIVPYCRSGEKEFCFLHRVLEDAAADQVITEEESLRICSAISLVESRLQLERKIEVFLVWLAAGILSWSLLVVFLA